MSRFTRAATLDQRVALTDGEAEAFAEKLVSQGTGELLAHQPRLQADLRLAGRTIQNLLRRLQRP